MLDLQQPQPKSQLDDSLALLGFMQKQWIRWADIALSHQRLAMITSQEKLSQIAQSRDPFRAQQTCMQMASEQLANNIQWMHDLWTSQFDSQSQWNQTWMHLLQSQQYASKEALQYQWMAAQPPADYAHALVESVMAMSRQFANGADHPSDPKK
jgi:hypothetical protein